jgi:hypothetical protein
MIGVSSDEDEIVLECRSCNDDVEIWDELSGVTEVSSNPTTTLHDGQCHIVDTKTGLVLFKSPFRFCCVLAPEDSFVVLANCDHAYRRLGIQRVDDTDGRLSTGKDVDNDVRVRYVRDSSTGGRVEMLRLR